MTDRVEALKDLLAKAEAGNLDLSHCLVQHVHGIGMNESMWTAYQGSLDAAKALHEALLPEWVWMLEPDWAEVRHPTDEYVCFSSGGSNIGRAWLIAILKAIISQEESK